MKVSYGAMPPSVGKMPTNTKLMVKYLTTGDEWHWWLYPHEVDWSICYDYCRFNWLNMMYVK